MRERVWTGDSITKSKATLMRSAFMCREPWLINLWFNGARWTRSEEDRYFGSFWVGELSGPDKDRSKAISCDFT